MTNEVEERINQMKQSDPGFHKKLISSLTSFKTF